MGDFQRQLERERLIIQFQLQKQCIEALTAFESVVSPDANLHDFLRITIENYRRFMNDPAIPLREIIGTTLQTLN